jgi:hypothetical protein
MFAVYTAISVPGRIVDDKTGLRDCRTTQGAQAAAVTLVKNSNFCQSTKGDYRTVRCGRQSADVAQAERQRRKEMSEKEYQVNDVRNLSMWDNTMPRAKASRFKCQVQRTWLRWGRNLFHMTVSDWTWRKRKEMASDRVSALSKCVLKPSAQEGRLPHEQRETHHGWTSLQSGASDRGRPGKTDRTAETGSGRPPAELAAVQCEEALVDQTPHSFSLQGNMVNPFMNLINTAAPSQAGVRVDAFLWRCLFSNFSLLPTHEIWPEVKQHFTHSEIAPRLCYFVRRAVPLCVRVQKMLLFCGALGAVLAVGTSSPLIKRSPHETGRKHQLYLGRPDASADGMAVHLGSNDDSCCIYSHLNGWHLLLFLCICSHRHRVLDF